MEKLEAPCMEKVIPMVKSFNGTGWWSLKNNFNHTAILIKENNVQILIGILFCYPSLLINPNFDWELHGMPVEWMHGSRSYNNFNNVAILPQVLNDRWISKKRDLSVYTNKIEFSDESSHRSHMAAITSTLNSVKHLNQSFVQSRTSYATKLKSMLKCNGYML